MTPELQLSRINHFLPAALQAALDQHAPGAELVGVLKMPPVAPEAIQVDLTGALPTS